MLLRWLTSVASPAGARARLLTFYFHRVLAESDPMQPGEPDAASFDRMLAWVGAQFNVLQPIEACERLVAGDLPERAALITFDDGYRDNHDVAAPILMRHGFRAAFFVATGFLGGGMQFNDRVREALRVLEASRLDADWLGAGVLDTANLETKLAALEALLVRIKHMPPPERLGAVARLEEACGFSPQEYVRYQRPMMSAQEVRALADAGMEIGGHTRHHPILRMLGSDEARREIECGRSDLTDIVGAAPVLFAYPNGKLGGDFQMEHCAMVKQAGFRFAFTTHRGAASVGSDPCLLPRYMPWQRSALRFRAQALRVVMGAGAPAADAATAERPPREYPSA